MEDDPIEAASSALDSLQISLTSSSTKYRTQILQGLEENFGRSDLDLATASRALTDLYLTYPRYHDLRSRHAVLACLGAALSNEKLAPQAATLISNFVFSESQKAVIAPTNALVLLSWSTLLQGHFADLETSNPKALSSATFAAARSLEKCLHPGVKPGVRRSALRLARRGIHCQLRSKSTAGAFQSAVMATLIQNSSAGMQNIPYLGALARKSASFPWAAANMKSISRDVLSFYAKTVIGSKGYIPPHVAEGLRDLFAVFVSPEDFADAIVLPLEKAILRSPEIILGGLIPSLVQSLPSSFDLSKSLESTLLQPLISSLKSTNPAIKEGAVQAFSALVTRSKDKEVLGKVCDTICTPLKSSKTSTPEGRNLLSRFLSVMTASSEISGHIVLNLASVAAKEANESALESEAAALCKHLVPLLNNQSKIDQAILDTIMKGCRDKRPGPRKTWHLKAGEMLWELDGKPTQDQSTTRFIKALSEEFLSAFKEVCTSPIAGLQNGLVPSALILLALVASDRWEVTPNTPLKKAEVLRSSLTISPKPSFLLSGKVIARLTSAEEMLWAIRALAKTSSELVSADEQVGSAWAQNFMYFMTGADIPTIVQQAARDSLTLEYYHRPMAIARSILLALRDWLQALQSTDKDSLALISKAGNERLYAVLKCINTPKSEWAERGREFPENDIKSQLLQSLVLCRRELCPRTDWISTCLAVGIDPGRLVQEQPDRFIREVLISCERADSNNDSALYNAACKAAADLAFVAPAVMVNRLLDEIGQSLAVEQLQELSAIDVAIARAPEGVPFVDVLSQKSQTELQQKHLKDYDILKWEEDLKFQLAQKKGQTKKLSSEQQAKVDAQLSRESMIRKRVRSVHVNIYRGARLVQALATGPPIDAISWYNRGIWAILGALEAGAALFIEGELASAYLKLSTKISARLGTLGKFIGVATLRATANARLSPNYEVEPLGELVTRVLYRLRFAAEQMPFDTVTLSYILPLTFIVLQRGSIGHAAGDDADTQVLLAIEFLTFHMDSCAEARLPREQILANLIMALEKYTQHYRILKDALISICRCISDNITPSEIQVLLTGVTSFQAPVRSAVLQAIQAELDLTDLDSSKEIWLTCHDTEDEVAELATTVWEENALSEEESLVFESLKYLGSQNASLRRSAARALAAAIDANPESFPMTLQRLQEKYKQGAAPLVPKRDKFGIVQRGEIRDAWELRSGIGLAFREMKSIFPRSNLLPFLRFLILEGPLADRSSTVREVMLDAGSTLISSRGEECLEPFMELCQSTLEAPDKGTNESDWVNEAVVVLYGSVARHLPSADKRIQKVVSQLIASLSTQSESVQLAVSGCLPPLVRLIDKEASPYFEELLKQLLDDKQYAARRGAAYGLAGFVQGRGIASLRQYRLMSALQSATENKKKPEHRQGAMLAYEILSHVLGRTFEPYVIEVLPQLLASFGDSNASVREACLDTAKTCFSNLSSFGVKKVLPRLLEGLEDSHWRSKKAACDLLGAMAYLDSQQLAASLPVIIPPLTSVLNDTHKEVRLAANRSLQRFGEVITNPEVKSLVNVLLKALSDPVKYTEEALDGLIKVSFVHYLDAPSLALVVRILERGLGDRSSTKRKSAQIIGSLAHLTERKDLITHLPILVTGLRIASVDPVPSTRATASKGLGSLVEKLGEDALPDLIPSLMSSLKTDTGAGDRLGSAQALSEVLAGLGTTRLEETMPAILQNVASTKPTVREGFMTLFIFLPACFGNSFANYLSQIIPSILGGLADELEAIRETSLRAGRLLVKNFSSKAIDLLLPELQRGLADDNYRIRLSSVELVGDLLFNITGISGKAEDEDDHGEGAAQAGQSLLGALGQERRDKVLSSLYICRCDTSGLVRSAAIAVWKALVATPRTLRELVPTLTQTIIGRLASPNPEARLIAGNALGEVIKKAGEGVLSTLLPALEDGLQTSTDADTRQGICTALREIIVSASPDSIEDYEKKLVSILRASLVDGDSDVREAAAEAFDSFQQVVGKKAVEHVLPYLLSLLREPDRASNALSGLLTLLTDSVRANMILPTLLQNLLTPPITAFNARALASLAEVGGASMNRRLPSILNNLADGMASPKTHDDLKEELTTAFDAILCSVDEYDGLNTAMSVMLAMIKHDDHRRRSIAASRLAIFFSNTSVDFSRYNQDLIRVLLISFDDRDMEVVQAAWSAMNQLVARLRKEEMESLATSTRQALQQVGVSGSNLPGFSLPKGILPVLQIFLQGLMNGTVDQRTQSALAISDIIEKSSPESLKPFVTQITGPLIRVVSERSVEVKCAILHTLNQLLGKIPTFLKPFLPQLQRTFTKSLADTSSDILRARAIKALSTLITLTPRVDPLITELVTGSKNPDEGVRNAMLKALQEVVTRVGSNMNETSKDSILSLIDNTNDSVDDAVSVTHARLLGALIRVLPHDSGSTLVKSRVLCQPTTRTSILALNAVLLESAPSLTKTFPTETRALITTGLTHKNLFVLQNSVLAAGKYLLSTVTDTDTDTLSDTASIGPIIEALTKTLTPGSDIDARRLALVVIRTVARISTDHLHAHLPLLVPAVFANVRDAVIPVKLAAEAAFIEIFSVVDDESAVFDGYMADENGGQGLKPIAQRGMGDYFRRVAVRLGAQARERREADGGGDGGGGGLGLSADEREDEREVWSVGRVVVESADLFNGG